MSRSSRPILNKLLLHSEWINSSNNAAKTTKATATGAIATSNNKTYVFLHGLLGNGKNVKTMARNLCNVDGSADSGILLDIRGHGKSHFEREYHHHLPAVNTTFQDCTRDIQHTLQEHGLDNVADDGGEEITLVGHSLGGRLALQYAYDRLEPKPHHVWLLDTVPGVINSQVRAIVNHLTKFVESECGTGAKNIDGTIPKRNEVTERLLQFGKNGGGGGSALIDKSMAMWLASSFCDRQGTFHFDLQICQDLIQDFERQDFFTQLEQVLNDGIEVDLVKGGMNKAWEAEELGPFRKHLDDIHESKDNFRIHTLPNAGHWVHIDDLPGLLKVMEE